MFSKVCVRHCSSAGEEVYDGLENVRIEHGKQTCQAAAIGCFLFRKRGLVHGYLGEVVVEILVSGLINDPCRKRVGSFGILFQNISNPENWAYVFTLLFLEFPPLRVRSFSIFSASHFLFILRKIFLMFSLLSDFRPHIERRSFCPFLRNSRTSTSS